MIFISDANHVLFNKKLVSCSNSNLITEETVTKYIENLIKDLVILVKRTFINILIKGNTNIDASQGMFI